MTELVSDLVNTDLHAIAVFLAVRLLFFSFFISVLAGHREYFNEASWILLVMGTAATISAAIFGLIPSSTSVESASHIHHVMTYQSLGWLGTATVLGILVWRYTSRRQFSDVGMRSVYRFLVTICLIVALLVAASGGKAWSIQLFDSRD